LAIRNAGESAHMKLIILNKLKAKRKVKCLEIPHYAKPQNVSGQPKYDTNNEK